MSRRNVQPFFDLLAEIASTFMEARRDELRSAIGTRPPCPPNLEDFKVFPDKQIGDFVYSVEDVEQGGIRYVVVDRTEEGHLLVCECESGNTTSPILHWAFSYHHSTWKEAWQEAAEHDLETFQSVATRARAILRVCKQNGDLSRFNKGME